MKDCTISYTRDLFEAYKKNFAGRPAKLKSPKQLMTLWSDYLAFMDNHPVEQYALHTTGDAEKVTTSNVKRCLTLTSFMLFCGFAESWAQFKASYIDKPEFSKLITHIEQFVKDSQIAGAVAGMYKENIVARLNGLKEHSTQEIAMPTVNIEIVGGGE